MGTDSPVCHDAGTNPPRSSTVASGNGSITLCGIEDKGGQKSSLWLHAKLMHLSVQVRPVQAKLVGGTAHIAAG